MWKICFKKLFGGSCFWKSCLGIVPICNNKPVFPKIVIYCYAFWNNKLKWQNFDSWDRCRKKFIATSHDVAINPGLLLHAIYTGLHKVEKSSETQSPFPSYTVKYWLEKSIYCDISRSFLGMAAPAALTSCFCSEFADVRVLRRRSSCDLSWFGSDCLISRLFFGEGVLNLE